MAETEKVKKKKSIKHIPTDNITELNELIYARGKLGIDKNKYSEKAERSYKSWIGNEARRTNKKKNATTSETAKKDETDWVPMEWKDPKKTTADTSDNKTGRNK